MKQESILELLKSEVLPTMGCTEPGAVALAAAQASALLTTPIDNIQVVVNANIYKNGVAVGIPGTGETGLAIAAALGAVKGHPERQLAVLEGVTEEELQQARCMVTNGVVQVAVDASQSSLWVQVRITADEEQSEVIIQDRHTNIASIRHNETIIFAGEKVGATNGNDCRHFLRNDAMTVDRIIAGVEAIDLEELEFLLEGVNMNVLAAQVGQKNRLGMGIGAVFEEMVTSGMLADDVISYAKILTASAADARMSGENVWVMSSAGSGNHGITATLPVFAVAKRLGFGHEKLVRAIAISHLINIYIKIHTGNLTALCGCAVAAATGATAAITWMMGGDRSTIEAAMKNIIANLTGMICDGGKVGCALKLSTAAAAAVESSLLAQRGIVVPDTNGIIGNTVEQTVKNLGQVSDPGMVVTDKVIMDVMLAKEVKR